MVDGKGKQDAVSAHDAGGKLAEGIMHIWRTQKSLVVLLFVIVILAFLSEHFFTVYNLINVARQTSIYAILAAGMTLVLTVGEIDLSVGSNAGFCGVIAAYLLKRSISLPLVILIVLGVGLFIGMINGVLTAKIGVPFFVATLATMSALTGASFLITGGYPISMLPRAWRVFGQGYMWGIPVPVILMIATFIVLQFIQGRTTFGRRIYAVGSNPRAAYLCGINTDRIRVAAYSLCGFLAALGGIVMSSRMDAGDPSAGSTFLMTLVAAPILGGTKLSGGEGTVFGTLIGALVLTIMNNGMSLMNLNIYWQDLARGLIVLGVAIPQIERRLRR
ncbi:MAG: ABC transporter permease [Firmicutes bacterium]|jgi:ribose transport system permease protein|nr:ABC transporter permease [Bacillota bacterium]